MGKEELLRMLSSALSDFDCDVFNNTTGCCVVSPFCIIPTALLFCCVDFAHKHGLQCYAAVAFDYSVKIVIYSV